MKALLVPVLAAFLLSSGCATERYLGFDAFAAHLEAADEGRRAQYWLLDDSGTRYLLVIKDASGSNRYQVDKGSVQIVGVAPDAPLPVSLKRHNIRLRDN